jgi:hypothetical protein
MFYKMLGDATGILFEMGKQNFDRLNVYLVTN